jgi:hypothetical protein
MRLIYSAIAISLLFVIACDKPTLSQLISAADFSIQEACSVEYLNTRECEVGNEIISILKPIAIHNDNAAKRATRTALLNELSKLPTDSKVKFYFNWILLIPSN